MRSIADILNLVIDGHVRTQDEAAAIIEEEVTARMAVCNLTEPKARKTLLHALGFATGYMTRAHGDQVFYLFKTEHPVWGKSHPTPAEAMQLGEEAAARRLQEND